MPLFASWREIVSPGFAVRRRNAFFPPGRKEDDEKQIGLWTSVIPHSGKPQQAELYRESMQYPLSVLQEHIRLRSRLNDSYAFLCVFASWREIVSPGFAVRRRNAYFPAKAKTQRRRRKANWVVAFCDPV
jgi:hypothetical protein